MSTVPPSSSKKPRYNAYTYSGESGSPTATTPIVSNTGRTTVSSNSTGSTTTTTNSIDIAALTDMHQTEMYQCIQKELRDLKKSFQTTMSPNGEKNNPAMTHLLRRNCNEYVRLKDMIYRKYDVQKRYVGMIIGMGNNENSQLATNTKNRTTTSNDNDDDEEEEEVDEYDKNEDKSPAMLSSTLKYDDIHMICAGGLHSVAILATTGKVISWGMNDDGELGRFTKNRSQEGKPLHVTGFFTYPKRDCEDYQIIQIAAGDTHTLFLSSAGNVYQCGSYLDNEARKFSDKDYFETSNVDNDNSNVCDMNLRPVHVYALSQLSSTVTSIYAGNGYNAALLQDETLVTWGMGFCGNLARTANMPTKPDDNGRYDLTQMYLKKGLDKEDPERLMPDPNIVQEHFLTPKPVLFADNNNNRSIITVACGAHHMLVIARDNDDPKQQGKLYSCGLNNYGQLGHGDVYVERHALTLVEAVKDIDFGQAAAGEHFSLVLSHDRLQLYSFGRNDYGQLGVGYVDEPGSLESLPQRVKFPAPMKHISAIDAGDRHAFALTEDDELFSWGFNEELATGHSQIDPEYSVDVYVPQKVDLSNVKVDIKRNENESYVCRPVYVSCGGQHTLILARPNKKNKA